LRQVTANRTAFRNRSLTGHGRSYDIIVEWRHLVNKITYYLLIT